MSLIHYKIAIIVFAMFCFAPPLVQPLIQPTRAQQDEKTAPRTIKVSGEAQVNVPPDQIVLNIGIQESDQSLIAAKSKNDALANQVVTLIKGSGIAPDKLKIVTDYISIGNRYYYRSNGEPIVARRTLTITIKDVSKFEDIFGAMLNLPIELNSVQFRTSELRKYRDQAREMAVTAAQEKAAAMAGKLGQKIGRPISIIEEPSSWWSSYGYYGYSQYSGGANSIADAPQGPSSAGDDAVAPGQINVIARVSVTFELAD